MTQYSLSPTIFFPHTSCSCHPEEISCEDFAAVLMEKAGRDTNKLVKFIEANICDAVFHEMDVNGDCKLTVTEFQSYVSKKKSIHLYGENEFHQNYLMEEDKILHSNIDLLYHAMGVHTGIGFTEGSCGGHYNVSKDSLPKLWNPEFGRDRCPVLNVYAVVPNEPTPSAKPAKPTQPVTNASKIAALEKAIKSGEGIGLDMSQQKRELKKLKTPAPSAPKAPPQPKGEIAAAKPSATAVEHTAPAAHQPGLMLVACDKPTYLGELIRRGERERLKPNSDYSDYKPVYGYHASLKHNERVPGAPKGFYGLTPQGFDEVKLKRIAEIERQLLTVRLTPEARSDLAAEQGQLITQTPTLPTGTRFVVGVKEN